MIPPIFIGNKLESEYKLKANHFNKSFASKSTPMNNDSSLPSSIEFYSKSRPYSFNNIEDNILEIVRAFNTNKAHGHNEISVRMTKICDKALVKICLSYTKIVLTQGFYLVYGKKSNTVSVYKIEDKQIIDNYRPISLLLICGNILEKILLNSI